MRGCSFCRGREVCTSLTKEKRNCGEIDLPKDIKEKGISGIDFGKEEIKLWVSELLEYAMENKEEKGYE